MQGWSIMNLSFFCVLLSLISTINLTYNVQAAKFIRNTQSLTCLDFTIPSSPSCTPAVLKSCPTDRFSKFSNSLKWDLIPVNTNETVIKSIDQYCLSTASNAVEVCPCDDGISQRWTLNDDKILSDEKCLGLVGTEVNIGSCQGQVSWKTYPIAPNAVNLYSKPDFADKSIQLFVDTIYDSKSLPIEFFSSPFSLEIPSGFELIIDKGNNNVETFDSDNAQMSPIDSLTSTIYVKIKPGLIVFEQPAYFGASEYIKVDTDFPSNSLSIGSVIVPEGLRGVVWSNPDFTGDNLGLFEPIANFTGVSLSSLDVDATTCENECSSGGDCSGGMCVCKPGFAGERCEYCSIGFFGSDCQECNCTGLNKNACDDGLLGTGVCKCNQGFTGENCVAECKCGNGICDEQGNCECNAGFLLDVNTKQCTECKEGYYKSELDCKSCPPGCPKCDETGKCTQCLPELEISPDNAGTCIPKAKAPPTLPACKTNEFFNVVTVQCEACDPACTTCFGQGPGKCLQCQPPFLYWEGSCAIVDVGSGKCKMNDNQSFFADNTRKICEACPSSCLDCSIPNFTEQSPVKDMVCTKCMAGFSLDNDKCVKDCGEGKYSDENFICQACDSSCASCKGPAQNDCIKCINKSFFSLDGVCSSTQCPSGFAAIDTVCTACHPDCLECSGPGIDQCTKCPSNRPILKDGQDGQCIEVCPKGTYADENDKCQKCDADCSSCIGPRADQCLGCNDPNKIIIEGSCSGSCPTGSGVNKIERLCQNLADGEILSPGEANKKNIIRLEWWHILLVVLASLLFLVLVVLLIRCCAVKRRKKKTKEFGDNFDDNAVALNLKNALRASRGTIAPPEMSHNLRSVSTQEESATPPTHERRKDDTWQRKQERRQKHMSINSDDYNNWKKNNSKVWENFDAVTEESSSNVEHEAPTERRNSYKYHNRSSKGSLRSNHRISVKRSYTVPDDWTLPKLENQ